MGFCVFWLPSFFSCVRIIDGLFELNKQSAPATTSQSVITEYKCLLMFFIWFRFIASTRASLFNQKIDQRSLLAIGEWKIAGNFWNEKVFFDGGKWKEFSSFLLWKASFEWKQFRKHKFFNFHSHKHAHNALGSRFLHTICVFCASFSFIFHSNLIEINFPTRSFVAAALVFCWRW